MYLLGTVRVIWPHDRNTSRLVATAELVHQVVALGETTSHINDVWDRIVQCLISHGACGGDYTIESIFEIVAKSCQQGALSQ